MLQQIFTVFYFTTPFILLQCLRENAAGK